MEKNFCEFCGNKIASDAVVCPKCGKQLEELRTKSNDSNPQIIINNTNSIGGHVQKKECDKWIAFLLCFFLGFLGAHKFYEGKTGLGILYIFTGGLFGIGILIDLIVILCNHNPYYI